MTPENGKEPLSEFRRKTIFLALVVAQDPKVAVVPSRRLMMKRFGVTESEIRQIELEGMAKSLPGGRSDADPICQLPNSIQ